MGKIFMTLLEISAGCSVVILIISLLSTIINRRFTAKWKYFIWLIIAVRLLVPFNPAFDIGQPKFEVNLPNTSVVMPITQTPPIEEQTPEFIPPAADSQTIPVAPVQPEQRTPVTVNLVQILEQLWLVGAVVFLGIHIGSYAVFKKRLFRWARPISRESRVFSTKEMLQNELGISAEVPVLICTDVTSPMMIGCFKSFLILPHENYSDTELYFILRHELTHFKRRDIWYKLLMTFANAVHWFNPAVWLMVRESNRDLEISCDSSVVRGADVQSRKLYSEAILANVRQQPKATVFSTYFYDGKKSLKERFRNILNTKKRKAGLIGFLVVILCIGLIGGAVSCSFVDDTGSAPSDDSSAAKTLEPFFVTSLLENESVKKHLNERYPNITSWQSVYEYHEYQDALLSGNLQEGSARYNAVAVVSTTQSGIFDRVVVSVYGEFMFTQTEQEQCTMTLSDGDNPSNTPYINTYKGKEKYWKLGKGEEFEVVFDGSTFCTFWFKEKGEALFFTEPDEPLRAQGVTQRPKVCHGYHQPYSEVARIENCYVLNFVRDGGDRSYGEDEKALYRDGVITVFEGIEGTYPQQSVLGESLIAWGTNTQISLYDLSAENFGTPIMTLGGNGQGLADSEVYVIRAVFTDPENPVRHCIMYYVENERQWRICTFNSDGEVLCNFSTGLEVIDETITSVRLHKGLLYFSYRPDGALGKARHYCVDVRPDKNHALQRID